MNSFPQNLNPSNKEYFKNFKFQSLLTDLRYELTKFILLDREDDYFILDQFYRKENINDDKELISAINNQIIKELNDLGWKTKLVFGGSSIYIYSKEPHKSVYFDDI